MCWTLGTRVSSAEPALTRGTQSPNDQPRSTTASYGCSTSLELMPVPASSTEFGRIIFSAPVLAL